MEIPMGMKVDFQVQSYHGLKKTIYGLFQSAREFYRELVWAHEEFALKERFLDPCYG
jgi:hypothetical protein